MGQHTSRVNAAKYRAATDRQVQGIVARRQVSPEGCWLFPGYINPDGYGTVRTVLPDGRRPEVMVHRLIYMRLVDENLPDDFQVDHTCHDPDVCKGKGRKCLHRRCFNPEHLDAVPGAVNLMRSGNFAAVNAGKDECIRGHEFTPENTHITPDGDRRCRACGAWHAANDRAARRMTPPPLRICRGCGADISHLSGIIWYCETCRPEPNAKAKEYERRHAEPRYCPDCGADISGRPLNAVRCEACSEIRKRQISNAGSREWKRRRRQREREAKARGQAVLL